MITKSLNEDIQTGDITAEQFVLPTESVTATIVSKDTGIFFGEDIIHEFSQLYPDLNIATQVTDGTKVNNQTCCATISGNYQTILKIERTLLNFLQRLCGVATTTNAYVEALDDATIQILDTRKTTPLLRSLEKKAVVAGGGHNHRFGLYDMVLIKENHLVQYIKSDQISDFNDRLSSQKKSHPNINIEIEVTSLNILSAIDLNHVDIIMFDNMALDHLDQCIQYMNEKAPHCLKEVSGNITLSTIHRYKGIDINRISIGSLTHSVNAFDLSLLVS